MIVSNTLVLTMKASVHSLISLFKKSLHRPILIIVLTRELNLLA